MLKRTLSLILTLAVCCTLLASCGLTGIDDASAGTSDISDGISDTSAGSTEDEPIYSYFIAQIVICNNDPLEDLACFRPEQDSEPWERIYVEKFGDGDVFPYYQEGEFYKIVYSGNIEAIPDTEFGFIESIHSITLKHDSRTYSGIDYGIGIMRQGYSQERIAENGLNAGKEGMGYGMLLATDKAEFTDMANKYFMQERSLPDDPTDLQKKTIAQMNKRSCLLDGYDEALFAENDLLMIFMTVGSGGQRFDISDITIESGVCSITVNETREASTADIAQWIIFVSLPKSVTAGITEYRTTYIPLEY